MVTFSAVSGRKLGGWSISETKHKKFLPLLPFVIIYDGYHMLKIFWKSADPHLLVLPGFLGQRLLNNNKGNKEACSQMYLNNEKDNKEACS